ncbi:MAG: histone deacetylase [Deltaproteobacteria bacterium]|jgi:acetoin utilization deacetylase AcuC-like enzyme|nr:histone deacetylase [Deltaproteobacteria bacterium]MBT4090562.1 histone deacetylase [Deltaproteobacteria bacterium]MBT4269300.1 histone deacetylase [Deltaproteobacteria bacterium]MBT4643262.1 histone deacetylase [Deltaproteobacteria bacterium]MBT6498547.1 histone deacetylase [Deltaproteobacteria bacterium]
MRKLTGLVTDPIYLEHETGQHPENADRLRVILSALQADSVWDKLDIIPAEQVDRSVIELIHDPGYIESLQAQIESGALFIGTMDCIVSARSFEVAEHAVGGMLALTKKVSSGELKNGFGLVRPPGHHAERDQAAGFCYFNNVAICAEYLVRHENYQRVLIMDYDVHHGNGTQHSFESRKDVFYCSIHENPAVCYPGTGFQNETGIGEGQGYTLNVPMRSFSGDDEYLQVLEETFIPAWREYKPDIVLISVGYDAHRDDPLARISITETTYKAYVEALCQIAAEFSSGKVVTFLEGGYNLEVIPKLALIHAKALDAAAEAL